MMMKDNVPSQSYTFFINNLLDTIRDEIASCMEKAYEQISLKECAKMLQSDVKWTKQYITNRGWNLGKDDIVRFQVGEKKENDELPTEDLAKMSITYAREMEQIV
jgi:26S proteasome regulatory subunit N12